MENILTHCRNWPEAVFEPGEDLLVEGRPSTRLYLLVEGSVAVRRSGVEIARTSEPGALFGEMSALLGQPVSATVSAHSRATVRYVDDPEDVLARDPLVAVHAARLLAIRLNAASSYIVDLKKQFGGEQNHLSMMDTILDALFEGRPVEHRPTGPRSDDPRL